MACSEKNFQSCKIFFCVVHIEGDLVGLPEREISHKPSSGFLNAWSIGSIHVQNQQTGLTSMLKEENYGAADILRLTFGAFDDEICCFDQHVMSQMCGANIDMVYFVYRRNSALGLTEKIRAASSRNLIFLERMELCAWNHQFPRMEIQTLNAMD